MRHSGRARTDGIESNKVSLGMSWQFYLQDQDRLHTIAMAIDNVAHHQHRPKGGVMSRKADDDNNTTKTRDEQFMMTGTSDEAGESEPGEQRRLSGTVRSEVGEDPADDTAVAKPKPRGKRKAPPAHDSHIAGKRLRASISAFPVPLDALNRIHSSADTYTTAEEKSRESSMLESSHRLRLSPMARSAESGSQSFPFMSSPLGDTRTAFAAAPSFSPDTARYGGQQLYRGGQMDAPQMQFSELQRYGSRQLQSIDQSLQSALQHQSSHENPFLPSLTAGTLPMIRPPPPQQHQPGFAQHQRLPQLQYPVVPPVHFGLQPWTYDTRVARTTVPTQSLTVDHPPSPPMGSTQQYAHGFSTPAAIGDRASFDQTLDWQNRAVPPMPQDEAEFYGRIHMQSLLPPPARALSRASSLTQHALDQPEAPHLTLPALLAHVDDSLHMSEHQVYLRQQIELFQATPEDITANTRGRNRPIVIGQVGIRCRHCAHLPVHRRGKATSYFPATLDGLYQAAQNMSSNHIQCGLCSEMPDSVKNKFTELIPSKKLGSRTGRSYWADRARELGLVDSEDGIAFRPKG